MSAVHTTHYTENRMRRIPMALLPYQQRWTADESPVKVYEKSRRIGISWDEAADSALLSASQNGMDTWYIGYNKDMAQEFIRDCAAWSSHYSLVSSEIEETQEVFKDGDEEKSVLAFVIRYASGHRVTALSSRPSNLRGKQGRVIIDEAAFHENLGELIKAAMALLMWGGQVHIISTHDGVDNEFNELVEDIRAGKKPYSLHRTTLDDALADGLYERICLRLGKKYTKEGEAQWRQEMIDFYGDDADEELFCIPKRSGGAYISRALIESRMSENTPVIRIQRDDAFALKPEAERELDTLGWCESELKPLLDAIPRDARCFLGEDFARSGDLSVFSPLVQTEGLKRRVPFTVELKNIPFRQQEQILFYIIDRLPNFRGAALDARGNGQYLAEVAVQKYGPDKVHAVMATESWYREYMPKFKAALEDGDLDELPQDPDTLDDIRAIKVINGVPRVPATRTEGKDKNKRHGDSAIAFCMAWYASLELDSGPVTIASAGRRSASSMTRGYS